MAASTRFYFRQWLKVLPIFILISVFAVNFVTCQDHGHAHDHEHSHGNEEPASYKYSKHANEDAKRHADNGHAHDHGHTHEGHGHSHEGHAHAEAPTKPKSARETGLWLWIEAMGATAIISASPVVILLFIPIENALEHKSLLKILLALASGGLLGDAFLHLIPHAMSPHSHGEEGHSHDHAHSHGGEEGHSHSHEMGVGLWVLAGIIAFLMVEKFVRYVKGGHSHSHSMTPIAKDDTKSKDTSGNAKKAKSSDDESEKEKKSDKKEDKVSKQGASPPQEIKVAGYLNLAADFAHNFTDGLAIGASFLVNRNLGIITTFNIFLHEIPHEVGDFAILVQSGCTKRKAMMLQFSTAIGAMLGTVCSLLAEGIGAAAVAWILPFTAGGFIYIATVSVIPELLEDTKLGQSIKEIIAMLIGVFMMVLIAFFE